MHGVTLTDAAMARLRPGEREYTVWDSGVSGLARPHRAPRSGARSTHSTGSVPTKELAANSLPIPRSHSVPVESDAREVRLCRALSKTQNLDAVTDTPRVRLLL